MVEWPQRVEPLIPADAIRVVIEAVGESTRRIGVSDPRGR